ncbi:UPF0175 family protein [Haloferax sulfurifontis]|uniref:DUF4065 domain-containing protein n=1 Tax=Haloferax sulfurifontis TaxID=255616 RepID=A0A830E4F8_9EURY|nr:UPF0175 family protein [Haloferax sulfurifontis]GGC52293.1 hypothetical protein GCM10007209_12450 [Haloferax sulfurifontis]
MHIGNPDPPKEVVERAESLDNAQKIFLLLLDAEGGEAVPGNLWLQKELFLIAKNLEPLENYLSFEAHYQGPYSDQVKDIIENLEYEGLVQKGRRKFSLTESGKEVATVLRRAAADELLDLIHDTKSLANDLSKNELLVYIYYTYPEMTSESLELDEVEANREGLARSLYSRGKVSAEKAAELAGADTVDFIRKIRA